MDDVTGLSEAEGLERATVAQWVRVERERQRARVRLAIGICIRSLRRLDRVGRGRRTSGTLQDVGEARSRESTHFWHLAHRLQHRLPVVLHLPPLRGLLGPRGEHAAELGKCGHLPN